MGLKFLPLLQNLSCYVLKKHYRQAQFKAALYIKKSLGKQFCSISLFNIVGNNIKGDTAVVSHYSE